MADRPGRQPVPYEPGDAQTLRAMFDASPLAILVADDEGRYVDANPAACRMFGRPREQLIGSSVYDFVPREQLVPTRSLWLDFRTHHGQSGEFTVAQANGTTKHLRYHAVADFMPGLHVSFLEDVTSVHVVQAARERAEIERDRMFHISTDMICVVDAEGRFLRANPAVKTVLGWEEAELLGRAYGELVHPDDLAQMAAARDTIASKGSLSGLVTRLRHRDGSYRWIAWSATRFDGNDYAVGRDVTAERELAAVREYERQLFEGVLRQMPDACVVCEAPSGRILLTNENFSRILRHPVLPAEEVVDFASYRGFHPDGRPYEAAEWPIARSLLHGEIVEDEDIEYQFGDGTRGVISASSAPLRNAAGEIVAAVALFRDGTERHNARRALELSEARFRALSDNLPVVIWVGSTDGKSEYFNRHWFDYTGLAPLPEGSPELDRVDGVVHPEDLARIAPLLRERRQRGEEVELTYRLRRHDGAYRWHLSRSAPIRDERGNIVRRLGYAIDIEDHKQAIDGLQLERDLRERFVAALSHDLRSPLHAIRLSGELLLRRRPDQPALADKQVERILRNVDHADQLIQNLLDASRISAGQSLSIERKACDLSALVRDIVQDQAAVHGERFELDVPPGIHGKCDHGAMRRTLVNLIANAIKYGEPGAAVRVGLCERDGRVELTVHNRGNPIPPDEQPMIFQPYHRGRIAPGQASGVKGWGLGLTLVRGTAEAHGGTVSVDSSSERGTTFTVTLRKT